MTDLAIILKFLDEKTEKRFREISDILSNAKKGREKTTFEVIIRYINLNFDDFINFFNDSNLIKVY